LENDFTDNDLILIDFLIKLIALISKPHFKSRLSNYEKSV